MNLTSFFLLQSRFLCLGVPFFFSLSIVVLVPVFFLFSLVGFFYMAFFFIFYGRSCGSRDGKSRRRSLNNVNYAWGEFEPSMIPARLRVTSRGTPESHSRAVHQSHARDLPSTRYPQHPPPPSPHDSSTSPTPPHRLPTAIPAMDTDWQEVPSPPPLPLLPIHTLTPSTPRSIAQLRCSSSASPSSLPPSLSTQLQNFSG